MILIRGIKEEYFARNIEKGFVGCRDLLSTLVNPPETGYKLSDYFEKNLEKALTTPLPKGMDRLNDPNVLYRLLTDPIIPYVYATYFHILNSQSLEWLDNFEEDFHFIAVNVKLDKITETAIGTEFFGSKISYVKSLRQIPQDILHPFYVSIMCSLENLYFDKRDLLFPFQVYNTLAFPLLHRELDTKYTEIENEFRFLAYDSPIINKDKGIGQKPRDLIITGRNTGIKYKGITVPGTETLMKSNLEILSNPYFSLKEVLKGEQGLISLESNFKEINISEVSDDYKYLGKKAECADYIKQMLKNPPEETYVERTVRKKYHSKELNNVMFSSSHFIIDY